MSSSAAAFARALSPSIDMLNQSIISATYAAATEIDPDDIIADQSTLCNALLQSLHAKISGSRSVDAVVDSIPFDYRPRFREHCLTIASWADKLEGVKASLARFEATTAKNGVPQRLVVKAPDYQFTAGFKEESAPDVTAFKANIAGGLDAFQKVVVETTKNAKKAELEFWQGKCSPEAALQKFAGIATTVWNERKSSFKIPTITYGASGDPELGSWVDSPQKTAERDVVTRCGHLLSIQICLLVELRHRALNTKIEKKKALSKPVPKLGQDIEMADATKPGPSIQSVIDKAVNARFKKLNLQTEKGKKGGKVSTRSHLPFPTCANDYATYIDFVWPEYIEESRSRLLQGPTHQGGQTFYPENFEAAHQSAEESKGQEKERRHGSEEDREARKGRQERESQGELSTRTVRPFFYTDLPDHILTLTKSDADNYLLLNTPLSYLLAGSFRNVIHTSDGVSVPPEIADELSLGMKYMLFTPPSRALIMEAWNEFQNRLRWRIFFSFKDGINRPYDPDYAVPKAVTKRKAPILPHFMEFGLVMGRRYVNKTIAQISDEKIEAVRKNPFAPQITKLQKFLADNDYVVTMTDKNLGLAVSKRDWIHKNELKLLEDQRNYRKLGSYSADRIMSKKCMEMQELADLTIDHLEFSELKLYEYFESKITESGAKHVYPQFHGLPKIHKKPTGFRPIIPCHSVCFNPAAKFVSKELKPLIKVAPTIIHGTKDLFNRISLLRIDKTRKWFFVSGDVVAYYPNVPLKKCIDIVCMKYAEWLINNADSDPTYVNPLYGGQNPTALRLKIFKRAIEIGNSQLITQHHGKYYEQLNGLAMGVADSPDLANLYGCFFEENSGILDLDTVAFYGRYIDDLLSLVYADNAEQALKIVSDRVKFDGCEITWVVSEFKCQFLDALLYKDDLGCLQWKPYVKSGNNRERIPWVSHHPLDVKRGVYIGECSRLAVLCSTLENYVDAIRDLNALYVIRGYPENLVNIWCRKNMKERWEKRFVIRTVPEHDEGVLVLKSRFDDVWNWFSAAELGKTITDYWSEWYSRFEEGRYNYDPSRPFMPVDPDSNDEIVDIEPGLFGVGIGVNGEEVFAPDLRKIGIVGCRWLVSRKRGTNLLDLANTWKKVVFRKLDETIADEGGSTPDIINTSMSGTLLESEQFRLTNWPGGHPPEPENINPHFRSVSPDSVHPEFGRISKTHNR